MQATLVLLTSIHFPEALRCANHRHGAHGHVEANDITSRGRLVY
jgi:hypothetical protein